jgi:hypothetical protein
MPFLKNAAISALSIILTLFLLEIIVRIFLPQDLRFNFSQWDEYVGFVNIPGIEGVNRTQDFQFTAKINSKGLRDREFGYDKAKNTYRIGVFGDSYTFGEGVQNNETYPKLLENLILADEQLNELPKKIEVLNFGIGKTGTSHQYAFYQEEGKKYHLDLVILGFLAANDFIDNLIGPFILKNNELVHNPAAYSSIRTLQKIVYYFPFYTWLAAHSHLTNLVRVRATLLDDRWRVAHSGTMDIFAATPEMERLEVEITRKLLTEFKREVNQDGAKLILVYLPAKGQKTLANYGEDEIILLNEMDKSMRNGYVLLDRLEKVLGQDFEKLDLTPFFAKLPIRPYYFSHDGHMTPLGLQLVASKIKEFLMPKLIKELVGREEHDF